MGFTYDTIGKILALLVIAAAVEIAHGQDGVHWPTYRGMAAAGVADGFETPTQWNALTGHNLRWKTPIPGLGHSSPAIWGERIFVTSAIREQGEAGLKTGMYGNIEPVDDASEYQWVLYCVNKKSGDIEWQQTVHRGIPAIQRHPKSSHANCTPAANDRRVIAFFGTEGLYCFDHEGNQKWKKDLGLLDSGYFRVPSAQWGFASSPVIHENLVIVQCDVQQGSFVAAFDIDSSEQVWRTPREDVPTWSTPTVQVEDNRSQVIVNGYRRIGGYELATGKPLWWMRGTGDLPVPTPIVAHNLIYITQAHGGLPPIYAVRSDASGQLSVDIKSGDGIAWTDERGGSYMPTPIVVGDHLFVCKDGGVLSCYQATTGELMYRNRVGTGAGFTASPVAANGSIYLTAESGDVFVVKAGSDYKLLAENPLGETCLATPAISEGLLIFRTRNHLLAIGIQPSPE